MFNLLSLIFCHLSGLAADSIQLIHLPDQRHFLFYVTCLSHSRTSCNAYLWALVASSYMWWSGRVVVSYCLRPSVHGPSCDLYCPSSLAKLLYIPLHFHLFRTIWNGRFCLDSHRKKICCQERRSNFPELAGNTHNRRWKCVNVPIV